MSVYTSVSEQTFSEILKTYSLGHFICSQGIQAGIENTNYFVTTTKGEYVFTLFEKINRQQLETYISLLQQLSGSGIACPQPQLDIKNQAISEIKNKPFTFVTRLKGKNLTSVNRNQCNAIAVELAKIHNTPFSNLTSSKQPLQNRHGKIWRENSSKKIMNALCSSDAKLLTSELEEYRSFDDSQLPKGIIHADLFKDNALFEGNQLTGVIDFYDACYDTYLYDLAITVNAWCTDTKGKLVKNLTRTFLQGYQSIRPLKEAEKNAWPMMLRIAATRFWLSRLEGSFTSNYKNPNEYRLILQNHLKKSLFNRISSCG